MGSIQIKGKDMKWLALGLVAIGMGIGHVETVGYMFLVPIALFMMMAD